MTHYGPPLERQRGHRCRLRERETEWEEEKDMRKKRKHQRETNEMNSGNVCTWACQGLNVCMSVSHSQGQVACRQFNPVGPTKLRCTGTLLSFFYTDSRLQSFPPVSPFSAQSLSISKTHFVLLLVPSHPLFVAEKKKLPLYSIINKSGLWGKKRKNCVQDTSVSRLLFHQDLSTLGFSLSSVSPFYHFPPHNQSNIMTSALLSRTKADFFLAHTWDSLKLKHSLHSLEAKGGRMLQRPAAFKISVIVGNYFMSSELAYPANRGLDGK